MSSLFTFVKTRERSLIFSWLKKSSFLKSLLLPNFPFNVIYNKNNILMMFKKVLFNDFESMLLSSLNRSFILIWTDICIFYKNCSLHQVLNPALGPLSTMLRRLLFFGVLTSIFGPFLLLFPFMTEKDVKML